MKLAVKRSLKNGFLFLELKHIIVEILNYQQLEKLQEVLNIRLNEMLEEEEKVLCNIDCLELFKCSFT